MDQRESSDGLHNHDGYRHQIISGVACWTCHIHLQPPQRQLERGANQAVPPRTTLNLEQPSITRASSAIPTCAWSPPILLLSTRAFAECTIQQMQELVQGKRGTKGSRVSYAGFPLLLRQLVLKPRVPLSGYSQRHPSTLATSSTDRTVVVL